MMKCYVLEQGQEFASDMEKAEISAESVISRWKILRLKALINLMK